MPLGRRLECLRERPGRLGRAQNQESRDKWFRTWPDKIRRPDRRRLSCRPTELLLQSRQGRFELTDDQEIGIPTLENCVDKSAHGPEDCNLEVRKPNGRQLSKEHLDHPRRMAIDEPGPATRIEPDAHIGA
jgi:hypothetical protein